MKVAFVTFPHSGHFNPMSALARRLQTRGHEAVLFSLPIAEAGARAAGLPFVPFGQDPALDQALSRAGEQISKSQGMEVFRHTLELMGAMLEAKRRELPDLFKVHGIEAVVADDADWYAGTIPLQLGLPFAAVSCALVYDFSGRTPPPAYDWPHEATPAARERNRRGAAELSKMISEMGRTVMAEPIAELEAAGLKLDWDDPSSLYANRPWITQCPREFDFEDPHRPAEFHHAGPFHDGGGRPEIAFPWERLTGAPLVYASMGTMLNGHPGVFQTILNAAARLPDTQLVLSVGQALRVGDLGPLPANAVVVNQAPQLPLLERASLTVTHAGLNTVLESLARGIPQVAIPVSYDQPGVAARIAHHGTGLVASLDGLTAIGLAALLREALDNPSYRKNARQIQNAIRRTDWLSRAAELLEAGLGAPRPTNPSPLPTARISNYSARPRR
jgi:MGT family glycosyltransferase